MKVNQDSLEWETAEQGSMKYRRKQLGDAADSDQLGCSLYELPAGSRSWPYHYHLGNEESLYVLSGSGTIRLDGDSSPLEAGDYVSLPADKRGAHRVINDGDEPLRYLAVSTMHEPDLTVYPDSEKVGVFGGAPPGSREERSLEGFFRLGDAVDYWHGEE